MIKSLFPVQQIYAYQTGSRDLGLLITLLACRHGIAEGLRFISIFDKDYQNLWKPVDMRVKQDPDREGGHFE